MGYGDPDSRHPDDHEPHAIRLRHNNHTKRNVLLFAAVAVLAVGAGVFAFFRFGSIDLDLGILNPRSIVSDGSDKNEMTDYDVSDEPIGIPGSESSESSPLLPETSEPEVISEPEFIESEPEIPEEEPEDEIKFDLTSWEFILANKESILPESFTVETSSFGTNGITIDKRIAEALNSLISDASSAGYGLTLATGYRTIAKQKEIFDQRVDNLMFQGYTEEDAVNVAKSYVAYPGTSDHNTGLGVDIVESTSMNITENSESYKWLQENASAYGFILRYPEEKKDITGFSFEPWHWRYVGKEAAEYIKENNLTLEEFINQFK